MDRTIDFWKRGSYNTYMFFPGTMAAICGVKAARKSVNRSDTADRSERAPRGFSPQKRSGGVFVFPVQPPYSANDFVAKEGYYSLQ